MNKIKAIAMRAKAVIEQNSPEILLGAGIAGMVAGVVVACIETPKALDIIEEAKENREKIEDVHNNKDKYGKEYTEEDYKKDRLLCYIQPGMKLVKNYAPALIIMGASIFSLISGHKIQKKRLLGIAAAYAALDKTFKEYRARVVEKYGEEEDKVLRYNIKQCEKVTETVDENGKIKKKKEKINVIDNPNGMSLYACLFDETTALSEYKRDRHLNIAHIKGVEAYYNDYLNTYGVVTLKEVYYACGIDTSYDYKKHKNSKEYKKWLEMINTVGWIKDPTNPNIDPYITITIVDANPGLSDDEKDPAFWIDFNCYSLEDGLESGAE